MGYFYRWTLGLRYLFASEQDPDNHPYHAVLVTTKYWMGKLEKSEHETKRRYFVCKPSVGFVVTDNLVEATWYPKAAAEECAKYFNQFYGNENQVATTKEIKWYHLIWWWLTFQSHYQSYDFNDFKLTKSHEN